MATCPALWPRRVWGRAQHRRLFISGPVTQLVWVVPPFPLPSAVVLTWEKDFSVSIGSLRGRGGEDFKEARGGRLDRTKVQASRGSTERHSLSVPA